MKSVCVTVKVPDSHDKYHLVDAHRLEDAVSGEQYEVILGGVEVIAHYIGDAAEIALEFPFHTVLVIFNTLHNL